MLVTDRKEVMVCDPLAIPMQARQRLEAGMPGGRDIGVQMPPTEREVRVRGPPRCIRRRAYDGEVFPYNVDRLTARV